jgi:hypothetical protein
MTLEAWMGEDKFKAQVVLPFEQYLKEAFREHRHLRRQYHYSLSTADGSANRKTMERMREASKADSDSVLPSSDEGNVSTDHDTRSSQSTKGKRHGGPCPEKIPSSHSANEDVVENPSSTDIVDSGPTLSWLNDLKSHQRRRPDPEDDDEADYTAENEDAEIGDPNTSRIKSARISQQSKRAKLTPEAK